MNNVRVLKYFACFYYKYFSASVTTIPNLSKKHANNQNNNRNNNNSNNNNTSTKDQMQKNRIMELNSLYHQCKF